MFEMRFHSCISDLEETAAAVEAVVTDAQRALKGSPDVAFLFFTAHHAGEAASLAARIASDLDPQVLIGTSAEGVIGTDREIERSPGIALLCAHLPDVRIHPFHIGRTEWADLLQDEEQLVDRLAHGSETRALIGFGDPFTTPVRQFLARLETSFPRLPLIGGMSSSARQPGENVLLLDDNPLDQGFVGVALSGPVRVDTVVSQGCRPIGKHFIVTKARDNIIEALGGRPALHALRETIDQLPESDQALLRTGLFVGRAISEYRESFSRGDFLVRNVMGVDQDSGGIAVTDYVRPGQTVQFHVRDAQTAEEDLSLLLESQRGQSPPAGGLLFSCNGRGTRLFPESCHDISAARSALPQTPIAGFFAAGELGPVGEKNFIHGHTASFALFRPIDQP
jgi:small ligand-binding sensory domain FIST